MKKISEKPTKPPTETPVRIQETPKNLQINLPQYAQAVPENNCVYIECNPLTENLPQENNFIPITQTDQPQITQIDYNQLGTFNVECVGTVQVYNGPYSMPLQHSAVLHNNAEMAPVQVKYLIFLLYIFIVNNFLVCILVYAFFSHDSLTFIDTATTSSTVFRTT